VAKVCGVVAQIFLAPSAVSAATAGDKSIHADTLADKPLVDDIMSFDNRPNKFVSEDDIGRVWNFAPKRLLSPWILTIEVADVAAANSTFVNFDDYLARTRSGPRHIHELKILRRTEHQGFHAFCAGGIHLQSLPVGIQFDK
jgi:hypothetical protein